MDYKRRACLVLQPLGAPAGFPRKGRVRALQASGAERGGGPYGNNGARGGPGRDAGRLAARGQTVGAGRTGLSSLAEA